MTNIWSVLLQTIEVSLLALFLLILKRIFKDKLSPKWQYASWSILFIRMLLPTGLFNKYFSINITIFLETIKTIIEKTLHSNYIKYYETIKITNIIPLLNKLPSSITDYLFIIYILGIFFYIIKYSIQYIKIKQLIRNQYNNEEVNKIALKYNLKPCKTILIEEIPTAFIFGIKNPILFLPNNIDEKIILHELIHVKNHDALQSVIWSILFAFHWCNPFMNYILKQIKNDMETLCDQEVLLRLDGEERRDYGRILLNMCSDSYASAFGTTSISNGSKHIKTRIESIVRFKKYPKGIGLVSICILILLMPLAFSGQTQANLNNDNHNTSTFEKEYALARARFIHPSLAGAIDTFVKGLNQKNEEYIMSITSNKNRQYFEEYYSNLPFEMNLDLHLYDLVSYYNELIDYTILNLQTVDTTTTGIVALQRKGTFKDGTIADIFEYIPIQIIDDDGYKVEINGNITYQVFERSRGTILLDIEKEYPYQKLNIKCDTGTLEVKLYKSASVTQQAKKTQNNLLFNWLVSDYMNEKPDSYADFKEILFDGIITYTSTIENVNHIGVITTPIDYDFDESKIYIGTNTSQNSSFYGGSNQGVDYTFSGVGENKTIIHNISSYKDDINFTEEGFVVRIYLNSELKDKVIVRW